MEDTKKDNSSKASPKKSFITVGPTLHYSHNNVQVCWLLAVATYVLAAFFWTKITTGSFWAPDIELLALPSKWGLDKFAISGVSIFEYPWQVLVLGLLMGILAIVPILVSLLMCFSYSLPFIFTAALIANLPGLAISVLISSFAVACRPLRFRSRFISAALCTAPLLVYWGIWGSIGGIDPIKWGFSFTPWITAWLVGLSFACIVLGIGHFTRYRPGLIWSTTFILLVIAVVTFEGKIGFDELDYQLYIAKNNPEHISEFYDHSIKESLDMTMENQDIKNYLSEAYFFPIEKDALREALKKAIQQKLANDRWPSWLIVDEQLQYQKKKQELLEQYDKFITFRGKSKRMPIALYYKALLSDYSPDIKRIAQQEILGFYSEYPHEMNLELWHRLYRDFADSPESAQARLRYAKHLTGYGRFEKADQLLIEAQHMVSERLRQIEENRQTNKDAKEKLFSIFTSPLESVMTEFKLFELNKELTKLRSLISTENRTSDERSCQRLAEFVMLNPHTNIYQRQLDELAEEMSGDDPLIDNILLAKAMLIEDDQKRADELCELHDRFGGRDGGVEAFYELAVLRIHLWQNLDKSDVEKRGECLALAKQKLKDFTSLYPQSIYTPETYEKLANLPKTD